MWVLVVDDDAQVRRVARRGLEQAGVDVVEAATGPDAIALVHELEVDVAVLDRQLPGMSGLELIGELRRVAPSLHIIMLTGASAEADRVLGLVSGADDYMVKPFSARELAARVGSARRRWATRAQLSSGLATTPAVVACTGAPAQIDSSAQSVVVLQRGRIVSVNPPALALLGADCEEQVHGHEVFEFIAPESASAAFRRGSCASSATGRGRR